MIIRRGKKRELGINEPLRHRDHKKPVTRRDFLAQGFLAGSGTVIAPSILGLLANPRVANALSSDVQAKLAASVCNIQSGAGLVPFICFDLAGGANIAGSNALVGQQGGQEDFLTTAGYSKLGIPGDMAPNTSNAGTFVDRRLGLAFHGSRPGQNDGSAFMRGIMSKLSPAAALRVNGVVIPASSENDTNTNPHNPMYGIAIAGARGELTSLIGSQSSDSGGNSMAPAAMLNPAIRPTKVDRGTDATGLVDTGDLGRLFPGATGQQDTVSVMESIERVSANKLGLVTTGLGGSGDAFAKRLVECSYVKTAYQAQNFGSTDVVDPRSAIDGVIGTSPMAVFTAAEATADREFEKTASVAKLVIKGLAGAGTISMGGFDYHTGDRVTGEMRDLRAGVCMGACLEYAHRMGKPLMLYVFSDGSLSANGSVDNSAGGLGKLNWIGDNRSTAASMILVYNPIGQPIVRIPGRQIGWSRGSGDVDLASHPAANSVTNLVELIVLNYLALHGNEGMMPGLFPNSVYASTTMIDRYTAFGSLANSTPPVPPPPPPPIGITSCNTTSISANHGHTFTVTPAQLSTTAAVTLPVTAGTDGHIHTLTLSVAQMDQLRAGQAVSATSSTDGIAIVHSHAILVTCV